VKRKSFPMTLDEVAVVEEAINRAERVAGGGGRSGFLLANICTEFLSGRLASDDTAMLPFILQNLERIYGGRIVHLRDAEMVEAWEEAMAEITETEEE